MPFSPADEYRVTPPSASAADSGSARQAALQLRAARLVTALLQHALQLADETLFRVGHIIASVIDSPHHILVASDAWPPQVNGVVRTLERTLGELRARGHAVSVVCPADFWRVPNPIYPEIELAVAARHSVSRRLQQSRPASVHISTEGPIGRAVRGECLRRRWAFTTAYHTRFPEYLNTLLRVPESWGYAAMRRFHDRGAGVMVATRSLAAELARRGFRGPFLPWSRGTDGSRFHPRPRDPGHPWAKLPRPISPLGRAR